MSFTYGGDPTASTTDAVRFLVGDTSPDEPLLSDEEIAFLALTWDDKNSVYYIASMAAEAIAARFAREVTVNSDSQSVSTSELQQKYTDLALRLMGLHERLLAGGNVDVGGILAGEQPDPTVLPTAFGTGMHDSIEAGLQDYGDIRAPAFPDSFGWS